MYRTILVSTLFFSQSVYAYNFKSVAEKHILPGYEQLEQSTAQLHRETELFCQTSSEEQQKTLRQQYVQTFLAWQDVQHLRLGPAQYLSREHRFQLWPDKRGSVGKHLSRMIAALKKTPDETFDISKKSVAVQGLSALERLLFAKQGIDSKNCMLMQAISHNLKNMSGNLLDDWTQGDNAYIHFFSKPSSDNPVYESETELAGQLLNSLHTQLEFMITQKLDRPLGKSLEKARGKRSESWRSQSALTALNRNLNTLQQLFELTFSPELKNKALDEKIRKQFTNVKITLKQINVPLKQAVSDQQQRQSVLDFRKQLSLLKQLIARDLASELSLSLGFNSLDGD